MNPESTAEPEPMRPLAHCVFVPHLEVETLCPPQFSAEAALAQALKAVQNTAAAKPHTPCNQLAFSLIVADDDTIQQLNHDYRGKNKPTNVLSFPYGEEDEPGVFYLGDIMLSVPTTAREAEEQQKPFAEHFTHLVVHGILHLLGYDHIADDEAEEMEALEIAALQSLNIKNPYLITETTE